MKPSVDNLYQIRHSWWMLLQFEQSSLIATLLTTFPKNAPCDILTSSEEITCHSNPVPVIRGYATS